MNRKQFHVLITNIKTDRNRGDAAMQQAVVRLFNKYFPTAKISLCSHIGANQLSLAKKESCRIIREDIGSFVGGPFPTYYEINRVNNSRLVSGLLKFFIMIRGLVTIIFSFSVLLMAWLNLLKVVMFFLPREFKRSIATFSSADVIVVKTENIREITLPFGSLGAVYFLLKLLYPACLAVAMKKPLAMLGITVWPLRNPLSRKLLENILNNCVFVTFREEFSLRHVQEMGIETKEMKVFPDFSFFSVSSFAPKHSKPYPRNNEKPTIGFTLIDWQEAGSDKRDSYIIAIINLMRHILTTQNCKILIIPQVTYPPKNTIEITKSIIDSLDRGEVEVITEELSLDDIIETYSQLDFLVASRVHSAIFSLCTGTPVLTISYDEPKAEGIMKMIGLDKHVVRYRDLKHGLVDAFDEAWKHRFKIRNKALEQVKIFKDQVPLHVTKLRAKIWPNVTGKLHG